MPLRINYKIFLTMLLATAFAQAENIPKFKTDPTVLPDLVPDKSYSLPLQDFLSNVGSGNLTWSPGNQKPPPWIEIDNANQKLILNPKLTDAGEHKFQLSVKDASDTGVVDHRFEVKVVAKPKWKMDPLDLGLQNEGTQWNFELKDWVDFPARETLTFRAKNLPQWMHLNGSVLSGDPKRVDVGPYSDIELTVKGGSGEAKVIAYGEVLKTLWPPKWKAKEFDLGQTQDFTNFEKSLLGYIENLEGITLSFQILSQDEPAWGKVSPSGILYGFPEKAGKKNFQIQLRGTLNGVEHKESALFKLEVLHVNRAPKWAANPLTLPKGSTLKIYTQDISQSATDPDGDPLSFELSQAPAWIKIDAQKGILSGTPPKDAAGKTSLSVIAKDPAGLTATTRVEFLIEKSNEPPVWFKKPIQLANVKEGQLVEVDFNLFAKDPDGDAVSFTSNDLPAWLTLSEQGLLLGKAGISHIGAFKFQVRVSDKISGSDLTDVIGFVEPVNHPPTWLLNPMVFNVKEDKKFDINISSYAEDKDPKETLLFQLLDAAQTPWVTLSDKGILTGTALADHLPEQKLKVRVIDSGNLTADAVIVLQIEHTNHAPKWKANPIVLANAKEDIDYTATLSDLAFDSDKGDTLRFERIAGGADWATVTTDGKVQGRPLRKDIGQNSFQVKVLDEAGEFAITTIQVFVDKVNKPPRLRQNPVLFTAAYEGVDYSFDLKPYAIDDDGDPLTFELVVGPSWLQISTSGMVSGKPERKDVGKFDLGFIVKDNQGGSAAGTGKIEVLPRNQPPKFSEFPVWKVKERSQLEINFAQYVADPDGDKIEFSLPENQANPNNWIKVDVDGKILLSPIRAQVGLQTFKVAVTDNNYIVEAELKVEVQKDPRPPIWKNNPVVATAKTLQLFQLELKEHVQELDGDPLRFEGKDLPSWLKLTAEGTLGGTPKMADLGKQNFTVLACHVQGPRVCTEGKVEVTVELGGVEQNWVLDTPSASGAKSELIWLIDNSDVCDPSIQELKKHIGVFDTAMKDKKVAHSGLFLSTDARKFDGYPIHAKNQPMVMLSNLENWVQDFRLRVGMSYTGGSCSNCTSSPIWSFHRLLARMPQFEDYQKSIMVAASPMDTLILTHQKDHYPFYTQNTPFKSFTATDFANEFLSKTSADKVKLRMSVIAPQCPNLYSSVESSYSAKENVYKILTDKTKGQYFVQTCQFSMKDTLAKYADLVSQRAILFSWKKITLSQKPMDPASIEVRLGETLIKEWTYDEATTSVDIAWDKIDDSLISNKLSIRYHVN